MESWEKIEMPLLEAFSQANRMLKTPKCLQLGKLQAVDIHILPMTREWVEHFSLVDPISVNDNGMILEAKIQNGLRTVFAEWNRLASTFNMIHLKFNRIATGKQCY
jgi:hypothetical protein